MIAEKRSESPKSPKKNETTLVLDSDRTLTITRTFNGPAHIVFDAYTKAELVKRWWAPKSHGVTMRSVEADVREGGNYRYVMGLESGAEIAFSGTYTEVTPYTRLVYTQTFEPMADAGQVIVTITFQERGQQTHMVSHEVYPSKEAFDAALGSGMESGMRETLDQLDELVASLTLPRP